MATAEAKPKTRRRKSTISRDVSRRRRLGRLIALAAALVVALVWLAPIVISKTTLLERIVNRVLSDLNGSIHVSSASLGWLSPVRLSGLEVRDASGNVIVDIPALNSEKSLLALVARPSELGTFRAVDPTVTLEVNSDETNLERIVASIASEADSSEESSSTTNKLSAALIIADGTIDVHDVEHGRRWLVDKLEVTVRLLGGPNPRVQIVLTGQVHDSEAGRLKLELDTPLVSEPPASDQLQPPAAQQAGQLRLEAQHLPLALVGACLRRVAPDLELDGRLTAQAACHWTSAPGMVPSANIEVNVVAENLFAAGSWLGADQLRLRQVRTVCRAVRQGGKLQFEKAEIACDLGHAMFQGVVPLDGDWRNTLEHETYDLTGELDLARLAQTLPSTIRVRDDTQITAGRIHLNLSRAADGDHFALRGRINADKLSAVHGGRLVHWPEPLRAEFAGRNGGQQLVIDRLQCSSSFLQLDGSGTSDNFSAQIWFDLDQLTARLEQFIDLGSLRLAGKGRGGLTIRDTGAETVELDGRLDAERFLLTTDGRPPWQDDQLTALVHLKARTDGKTWQSLDSAELQLVGGPDRFTVRLQRPIPEPKPAGPWPIEIRLVGELARWHARLAPWFAAMDDWQLGGQCELAAVADYSSETIDIAGVQLHLQNFRARGGGLFIDEPTLEVRGNARLSSDDSSLRVRQLVLGSRTLSATSQELVLNWSEAGLPAGHGNVSWRGDLNRMQAWLRDPREPPRHDLNGQVQGELQFAAGEGPDSVRIDAVIQQMTVAWAGNRSWREPQMRLVAHVTHDRDGQALSLEHFELTSAGLACSASGQLTELTSRRWLELEGQLQYDLARLEPLLQAFAGEGIRIAGHGQQPFSIRGPLVPLSSGQQLGEVSVSEAAQPPTSTLAQLEARAALDWQSADIYGFRIGPGQLRADLARGILGVAPLDLLVSEGRFQAAPLVRFEPGPAELQLGPTKLFDDVRITPAISQQALKYVAPVLAGVSHAEGRFSIDLDGARMLLASPQQCDLSGRLTVHAIQISPGPLVEQFAVLFGTPRAIQLREQSVVTFRMVDGRVYHQGLELVWPDATIRTYGSVGTDGTLALMAEMPVPEKWIGNSPLGDSLRNQIIRLPIGGTLQQPRLDQQALQRAGAKILRNTGVNTLRHELNRQLDRLLGPPRQ